MDLVDKFSKGLFLEKSNMLIPWNTPFDKLTEFGTPTLKKHSDQRSDIIWQNEKILNGLTVDLIAMRWFGLFGMNKKIKYVYGHITKEDFEKTKTRLDTELGKKGKSKKLNALEYKYIWDLVKCKITLSQQDRFGIYWQVSIQHKSSWYGLLE